MECSVTLLSSPRPAQTSEEVAIESDTSCFYQTTASRSDFSQTEEVSQVEDGSNQNNPVNLLFGAGTGIEQTQDTESVSGAEWVVPLNGIEWMKRIDNGSLTFDLHAIVPRVHVQALSANRFFHSKDRLKNGEWSNFYKFDKFMVCSSSKVAPEYQLWKEKILSQALLDIMHVVDYRGYTIDNDNNVGMMEYIDDKDDDVNNNDDINNNNNNEHNVDNMGIQQQNIEDESLSNNNNDYVDSNIKNNNISLVERIKKRKRVKKDIKEVKRNTAVKRSNAMIDKMRNLCMDQQEALEDVLDIYIRKNHQFLLQRISKYANTSSLKKIQRLSNHVSDLLEKSTTREQS